MMKMNYYEKRLKKNILIGSKPPVVILAGGKGSRITEYTKTIPKPLIRIYKLPIIIRIIDLYVKYNFEEFFIATGYLHKEFVKYFSKNFKFKDGYYLYKSNVKIKIVFTGNKTMTGGRILRLNKFLNKNKNFCLTYGDGLSDIDLDKLITYHIKNSALATITAVRPPARFGYLKIKKDNRVVNFGEKKMTDAGWINGGFFVFNIKLIKYIKNDLTFLEKEPLEHISKTNKFYAFKHYGFWQCMDTLRDKIFLDEYYKKQKVK